MVFLFWSNGYTKKTPAATCGYGRIRKKYVRIIKHHPELTTINHLMNALFRGLFFLESIKNYFFKHFFTSCPGNDLGNLS